MRTPARYRAETKYTESTERKANTNLPLMARVGDGGGVDAVVGRANFYWVRMYDDDNRVTQCYSMLPLANNDWIYMAKARDRNLTYYEFVAFIQLAGGGVVPPVQAHDLLGPGHGDTTTDAPTQGSMIRADATSEWDELVLGGARQILQVDGVPTTFAWASFDWDLISTAAGADMVHDHSAALEGGQDLRQILEFEVDDAAALTIDAGGTITRTQTYHEVDTFGAAATDDLDTINGGVEGDVLILRPVDDARTVVVKHQTGNIWLMGQADISLDEVADHIMLVYDGADWCDMGAGVGGAVGAHNLLSATHLDTVVQAVSAGSLIYGDATPDWNELVHPGATANHLQTTGAATLGWSTNIVMADGATIGQAAGPLITFDDTLNYLEIMGCNVGMGIAIPALGRLEIWGAKVSPDVYNYGMLVVHDTTAFATGVGGAIAFSGYQDAVPNQVMGGSINLYKINGVAGNNSFGLRFYTKTNALNPAVRMTIDHLGNVGIGTTTIGTLLTLAGDSVISVATPADDGYIGISGTDALNQNLGAGARFNGNSEAVNPGDAEIFAGDVAGGAVRLFTGAYLERVTVIRSGEVGINTTGPDRLFHVEVSDGATNSVTHAQRLSHITSGAAVAGFGTGIEFELEENDGTNKIAAIIEVKWSDAGEGANADAYLDFSTMLNDGAAASMMRMGYNGMVGIGVSAPTGAQLTVDQSDGGGDRAVLLLDQADLSEEFIEFTATVGAGNPIDTAALGGYYGKARVSVTGVGFKWIALYN